MYIYDIWFEPTFCHSFLWIIQLYAQTHKIKLDFTHPMHIRYHIMWYLSFMRRFNDPDLFEDLHFTLHFWFGTTWGHRFLLIIQLYAQTHKIRLDFTHPMHIRYHIMWYLIFMRRFNDQDILEHLFIYGYIWHQIWAHFLP